MKFEFDHYIFASGAPPPVMTGEIKINVNRTQVYVFKETTKCWEEGSYYDEHEMPAILSQGMPQFNWDWVDPKNEVEIQHRMSALLMHGNMKHDHERVETIIVLSPGANFSYHFSTPNEEGYSSYSVKAEWNGSDGWDIVEVSGGRDCDGPCNNTTTYSEDMNGNPLSKEKTIVYDEFAQISGY